MSIGGTPAQGPSHGISGVAIALASIAAVGFVALGLPSAFGPSAPWTLSAAVIGLSALAAWRPTEALILVAGLAPMGGVLASFTGTPDTWTLPLAFAAVVGATIRESRRADTDPLWATVAAAWYATVLASMLVMLFEDAPGGGPAYWHTLGRWLVTRFPIADPQLHVSVRAAALAIVGVQLATLVARVVRRDPSVGTQLLRAALLGVAAVGVFSLRRGLEVAFRHPPFLTTFLTILPRIRVSAAFPDVNAASALFLLMLPVALEGLRQPALKRWAWLTLPWLLVGLWLAGSRASLVLMLALAVMTMWLAARPVRLSRVKRVALPTVVVAVAGLLFLAHPRSFRSSSNALTIRTEMAETTGRMVEAYPIFGAGIGGYYASSPPFMSTRMRDWYPAQNAHNQFLQVIGELGLPGLLAFTGLLTLALASSTRRVLERAVHEGVSGTVIGLLGFLVASLTMHPLLVPEVALVFWILLGVARASGSTRESKWVEDVVALWIVLLIVTAPLRIDGTLR